ncbi:MAG: hypothetical protein BA865_04460 [Desulfobacterales bacterium S5133MH4]|nr:MAG: hypothetical protein BA865_04460 [Desulfobacterales bacterium S5133MH4]
MMIIPRKVINGDFLGESSASRARREGVEHLAIASLSNAAIDVHGRRKSVICGLSRYIIEEWVQKYTT